MRARALASSFPSISLETDALTAARLLADNQRTGLLVTNAAGLPCAVLTASRLLQLMIPRYVVEDPSLGRVIDELHTAQMRDRLAARSVGDCLPKESLAPPVANAEDTVLEVAALMVRENSPLVVVAEHADHGMDPRLLGVITTIELLGRLSEDQP